MAFAVLRLRPEEFQYVGPPRARLRQIGAALAGWQGISKRDDYGPYFETVSFRGRMASGWEAFAAELAQQIQESLEATDCLILDLSFALDEVGGSQYPDLGISQALRICERQINQDDKRILLIHTVGVTPIDGFMRLIASDFSERILVANTLTGELSNPNKLAWQVPLAVRAAVRVVPDDVRDQLEERIVRRRGVFEIPETRIFEGYRYTAEQCAAELAVLMPIYFEQEGIKGIVFDASVDPWFREVVKGAAVRARITLCQSTEDLASAELAGKGSATLSAMRGTRVCLVIPMFKSGHNVRILRDQLEKWTNSEVVVLAVMANPGPNGDKKHSGRFSGVRSLGGVSTPISYFTPVMNLPLQATSWLVKAALAYKEDLDPRNPWSRPTRSGILSLLDKLGASQETNVPQGRAGITWFPSLSKLGTPAFAPDALWLAECVVRAAVGELACDRGKLLVIVPDDDGNGSRPIGRAMKDHLDVHVLVVPRSEFRLSKEKLRPDIRRAIMNHASVSIVLFDESAVSYGTFIALEKLVRRVSGNPPALSISIVEAVIARYARKRPDKLHSFHSWTPLSFKRRSSVVK